MKTKIPSLIVLITLINLLILPHLTLASSKHKNIARKIKQEEEIEAKIDAIPIYRKRLEVDYQLLGRVRGQDIFSNDINGIARQVRIQAYEMGADAIIEFQCESIVKSAFKNCQGIAIKFAKGKYQK